MGDDGVEQGGATIALAAHVVGIDVAEGTGQGVDDADGGGIHGGGIAGGVVGDAGVGVAVVEVVGVTAGELQLCLHLRLLGGGAAVVGILDTGTTVDPVPSLRHVAAVVGDHTVVGPVFDDGAIDNVAIAVAAVAIGIATDDGHLATHVVERMIAAHAPHKVGTAGSVAEALADAGAPGLALVGQREER